MAPLAVGALSVPYLLRHTGTETFGVLTLIWALMGYFSLFDFGLGRALTQQISHRLAFDGADELPVLIKSGLLLAIAAGAVGGVALAIVAWPLAVDILHVSAPLRQDAFLALLIAAIGVPVTTGTVALRGVLEAHEDFRSVNLMRSMLGFGTFGLPALSVLVFGPSLVPMVVSLMAARLLFAAAHWYLVRRRMAVDLARVRFDRRSVHGLMSFGAWMTVSNIVSPLMVTADRFLISAVLGAAVVAYYTVPSELVARILIVPGALTSALFPRLAALFMQDRASARVLYLRCLSIVAAVLVPICLALALGAQWGLARWLGSDFASRSAPILVILSLGLWLNGVAFIPFATVQAVGLPRVTAQLHLFEALLYFPLLWYGMHAFGLVGAAFAWTARVGIDLALLLVSVERLVFRHDRFVPRMRHNFPSTEPQRIDTP